MRTALAVTNMNAQRELKVHKSRSQNNGYSHITKAINNEKATVEMK